MLTLQLIIMTVDDFYRELEVNGKIIWKGESKFGAVKRRCRDYIRGRDLHCNSQLLNGLQSHITI
jgi:hypothetical protein